MRGPGRWFKEEVLGSIGLLIALRQAHQAVERGEQPEGERALVWTEGSARLDFYDESGRLRYSMPLGDGDDPLTREGAAKMAADLGWRFEADRQPPA